MTRARWVAGAAALLVAIQLVPLSRSNPPAESPLTAPPDVEAILERSCMDCHSHATRWPWYAYVAPASWLVVYDVHEAREHLNFSRWGSYAPDRQRRKLEEMVEETEGGSMPMTPYLWLHPEAKLSEADLATLRAFAEERTRALEAGAQVFRSAPRISASVGKRPAFFFENTLTPSTRTSNTPPSPRTSAGLVASSRSIAAASLVASGR